MDHVISAPPLVTSRPALQDHVSLHQIRDHLIVHYYSVTAPTDTTWRLSFKAFRATALHAKGRVAGAEGSGCSTRGRRKGARKRPRRIVRHCATKRDKMCVSRSGTPRDIMRQYATLCDIVLAPPFVAPPSGAGRQACVRLDRPLGLFQPHCQEALFFVMKRGSERNRELSGRLQEGCKTGKWLCS